MCTQLLQTGNMRLCARPSGGVPPAAPEFQDRKRKEGISSAEPNCILRSDRYLGIRGKVSPSIPTAVERRARQPVGPVLLSLQQCSCATLPRREPQAAL